MNPKSQMSCCSILETKEELSAPCTIACNCVLPCDCGELCTCLSEE